MPFWSSCARRQPSSKTSFRTISGVLPAPMLSRMACVSAVVLGTVAGLLSAIGVLCGTTDCIQRTCMLSSTWSGRLQRDHVVRTCEKWIREVTETESARAKRMNGHLDQIRSLLAAL